MIEHLVELLIAGIVGYLVSLRLRLESDEKELNAFRQKAKDDEIKKNIASMSNSDLDHDLSDNINRAIARELAESGGNPPNLPIGTRITKP